MIDVAIWMGSADALGNAGKLIGGEVKAKGAKELGFGGGGGLSAQVSGKKIAPKLFGEVIVGTQLSECQRTRFL